MPYIRETYRYGLDPTIWTDETASNPGELNFQITRLVDNYIKHVGGNDYDAINAAIGALECAKLELYRRIAAPYEDVKKDTHGDVYA